MKDRRGECLPEGDRMPRATIGATTATLLDAARPSASPVASCRAHDRSRMVLLPSLEDTASLPCTRIELRIKRSEADIQNKHELFSLYFHYFHQHVGFNMTQQAEQAICIICNGNINHENWSHFRRGL